MVQRKLTGGSDVTENDPFAVSYSLASRYRPEIYCGLNFHILRSATSRTTIQLKHSAFALESPITF